MTATTAKRPRTRRTSDTAQNGKTTAYGREVLGRAERASSGAASAICLHRTSDVATYFLPHARIARGAVPYRGTIADSSLLRRRGGGSFGVDPVCSDR